MLKILKIPKPKLGLVILHVLLWAAFLFLPFVLYRITILDSSFYLERTINNLLLIGLFYFHYYYIFPRFFIKNKLRAYIVIVIGCILVFTIQQMLVDFYFMHNYFAPVIRGQFMLSGNPPHHRFHDSFPGFGAVVHPAPPFIRSSFFEPGLFWIRPFMQTVPAVIIIFILGGFIRVALRWFESEKQKEALEIKKLNAELDFLKAQINPHFLFNSLNTIYALAHKQSAQTESATLKLSQILRYVIYETPKGHVPISREISYIENYIGLQKYRIDKNFAINYNGNDVAGDLLIEPMLLIPFIENAFKHGLSYRPGSFIDINIYTVYTTLYFMVTNSFVKNVTNDSGGIGLANVRRRLELSYPGRHTLAISNTAGAFMVNLEIQLNYDELLNT